MQQVRLLSTSLPPIGRVASIVVLGCALALGCASRGTAPPTIEHVSGAPGTEDPETLPDSGDVLRIATANLWGVAVLGFDWADEIDARFAAFAARLARSEPELDVVLIQEAWKDSARRSLLADPGVARRFPFRVDAVEKPGGSGLVILSRHPIEEALFHRFEAQGNCFKFWEGDCLGGKGLLVVRANVRGRPLWLGTTHLIACYAPDDAPETACDRDDPNGATRSSQIVEMRRVLEQLAGDEPVLLGGDFNLTRSSRFYTAMTQERGWNEPGDASLTPDRIDFLWTRPGRATRWRAETKLQPIFSERVALGSGESIPLSDHPVLVGAFCLIPADDPDRRCLSPSSPAAAASAAPLLPAAKTQRRSATDR